MELLNYVEFDCLKIDKSFVDNLEGRHLKILESIVGLSKALNIDTVIEGVETSAQNEYLKQLGCNCIQGCFFGKPEPFSALIEKL